MKEIGPPDVFREKIEVLEDKLRAMPQVEIEPTHYHADGLYAREITIKAGTVLTGKIHNREHLNFILSGDISVATEEGTKRIKAPAVIISKPGTKRLGYAHEDTIWVTVHATDHHDLVLIERDLISDTYPQYLEAIKCLGLQQQ